LTQKQAKIGMPTKKQKPNFGHKIGPKLTSNQELHQYEESFRRWLSQELLSGRLTMQQAMDDLSLDYNTIRQIQKRYSSEIVLTLPLMTASEKLKFEKLQERLQLVEKDLEKSQIRNMSLDALIDVAEETYKIAIRKKSGAKQ
jgi:hypothetical protein